MSNRKTTTTTTVTTAAKNGKPQNNKPKPKPQKQKKRKNNQARKQPLAQQGVAVSYAQGLGLSVGRYTKLTNRQRVTGSDYLDDVTVTGASGTVIYSSYKLNPLTMLPNSRLAGFARLYEKFSIKKLRVHFDQLAPTGTAGQVMMWFEPNPELTWTQTGTQLLTEVAAMQCRYMCPPWQAGTMNVPEKVMQNAKGGRWFVNPANAEDPVDTYAGLIYIGVDNLNSGGPTMVYGRLIVEWEVEFYDAQNSTQSGDAFTIGNTAAGSATDANPFGLTYTTTSGDPGLLSITSTGTDNMVAFSTPGSYTLEATSSGTGGAALTGSSTIATVNASGLSSLIYSASGGAQKVWRIQVTVLVSGGGFTIHDAGGTTHPNGFTYFTVVRTSDLTLTKGESREKASSLRIRELEDRIFRLMDLTGCDAGKEALDPFVGTTTVSGTIQDGNQPLETVNLTSTTTYAGVMPVEVVAPSPSTSSSSSRAYLPSPVPTPLWRGR